MNDIFVAEIVGVHGLKGALKVNVADENPKRFSKGRTVYLESDRSPLVVMNYQSKGLHGILSLQEITTIDQAESLVGKKLVVPENELLELEEGQYYIKDLIGLDVFDLNQNNLGTITDVLTYAVHDVYVIKTLNDKQAMVPAVKEIVHEISIEDGCVILNPIKGLFDED